MKNKNINKENISELKTFIKPSSEIIVVIHSVSSSGMMRKMSAYVIKNKKLVYLNGYLRNAGLVKLDNKNHIIMGGCGMDMTFALTDQIKTALYGYKKALHNQQTYAIY